MPRFRRCRNRVIAARATVGVEALSSKVVVSNGVIQQWQSKDGRP